MKILQLVSYYAPERVANSHLSKDREDAFAAAGFHTELYVPTPTRGVSAEERARYKKIKREERHNGQLVIHRFSMFREGRNPLLRAIRYLLVNVCHYFKASRAEDVDVIFCGSTPPTQGALCGLIKKRLSRRYKRNVPFVFVLQDIFPDSLVNAKMTKKGSIIWKIGRKIEDFAYRSADKIIVISEGFKRNIMEKGVPEEKIVVIPNWIDTDSVYPVAKEDNRLYEEYSIDRNKFIVVYAGNCGVTQGTNVILEAAEMLQDCQNIQFVLFGAGSGYEEARKYVQSKQMNNVIIDGLLPQDRVSEVYSLGDVALITCKKGVGNAGMPSKTWSIMACNTPIIASFDQGSDLAEILAASKAGVCVAPEDSEALANAIRMKADGPESKQTCNSRAYVQVNASREKCTQKYVETLSGAAHRAAT